MATSHDDPTSQELGALVVVDSGESARIGQCCRITKHRSLVGAHGRNDIVLYGYLIAPFHAVIERRDDGLYVRAAESPVGVCVDGDRVFVREHRLSPGDVLALGDVLVRYVTDAPREPEPDPPYTPAELRARLREDVFAAFGSYARTLVWGVVAAVATVVTSRPPFDYSTLLFAWIVPGRSSGLQTRATCRRWRTCSAWLGAPNERGRAERSSHSCAA